MSLLAFPAAVVACLALLLCSYLRRKPQPRLPPGPKPLPIVGNLLDLPPKGVPGYQHWLKHKDVYGPISSVTVLGQTLIILHDKDAAQDLLEKRAKHSSSRPRMEFASLCGFSDLLSSQQHDDTFRHRRKLVHQQLGTKAAAAQLRGIQEQEVRRFLLRALQSPETVRNHLRTESGAIVLNMAYGYSVASNAADPLVTLIDGMMSNFSQAVTPLGWLVDVIPALKYLPSGLPGMKFKETAKRWNSITQKTVNIPFSFVCQQMKNGTHRPSYVSKLVQQIGSNDAGGVELKQKDEEAIKWTAVGLYGAGTDTTSSAMAHFILAMVMFPDVQRRAREEIDSVTGGDRLPTFEDREKLSYVDSLVKEVFRWSPVVPMGLTHALDEDIVYGDYLLPKGAYLLPSIWWFLHDPNVYEDPSSFNPDRYMEPRNEPDPKAHAFGYGRRICPGRFVADASIFLTVVHILAVFDIRKAVDEHGEEIGAELTASPGIISQPNEFAYDLRPRSAKHERLIRLAEQVWEEGDSAHIADMAI